MNRALRFTLLGLAVVVVAGCGGSQNATGPGSVTAEDLAIMVLPLTGPLGLVHLF